MSDAYIALVLIAMGLLAVIGIYVVIKAGKH